MLPRARAVSGKGSSRPGGSSIERRDTPIHRQHCRRTGAARGFAGDASESNRRCRPWLSETGPVSPPNQAARPVVSRPRGAGERRQRRGGCAPTSGYWQPCNRDADSRGASSTSATRRPGRYRLPPNRRKQTASWARVGGGLCFCVSEVLRRGKNRRCRGRAGARLTLALAKKPRQRVDIRVERRRPPAGRANGMGVQPAAMLRVGTVTRTSPDVARPRPDPVEMPFDRIIGRRA